jgi:peroxiredoxin
VSDFEKRGVHLAAISVDPVEKTAAHGRKIGYTFTFLSDPNAEVIRRYDVLHRGAGPKGNDIARPAEFFVDGSGTVRWVNLTENIAVRARPEQALNAIDAAK